MPFWLNAALGCLLFLWVFLPLLLTQIIPIHDGMTVFTLFYEFYNEFFLNGDLAQWSPFNFYGQPAHFNQLVALTPIGYLFLVIGKIVGIQDVLVVYKLSMGVEALIFALGLWVLSGRIYQQKVTQWFVVITLIATSLWLTQPFYNLRIFYLWPLIILAALDFIKIPSLKSFAWMAFLLLISFLGNLPYFAGVWLLTITVLVSLLWLMGKEKKSIQLNGKLQLVGVLFVAAVIFLYLKGLNQGVDLVAPNRTADGSTTLNEFLSYGDPAVFQQWFLSTINLGPVFLWGLRDIYSYVGIVVIGLMIWSIVMVKQPMARIINGISILFLLIIFVPWFATIVYYFPMMKFYRHLSLLIGFIKLFMVLGAGFGLDDLLRRRGVKVRFGIYCILMLAAIDLTYYQVRLWKDIVEHAPRLDNAALLMRVNPLSKVLTRTSQPLTERQEQASRLVKASAVNGGRYTTDYSFIQWDACNSPWRRDWLAKDVHRIGGINQSLLEMLGGCDSAKLRLEGHVVAISSGELTSLLSNLSQQVSVMMSQSPQLALMQIGEIRSKLTSFMMIERGQSGLVQDQPVSGRFNVREFNHNELVVDAQGIRNGLWLLYADAYHEGWRATIDKKHVEIVKANGAFKAVYIPSGDHQVRFYFMNGIETVLSYALMFIGVYACVLIFYHIGKYLKLMI